MLPWIKSFTISLFYNFLKTWHNKLSAQLARMYVDYLLWESDLWEVMSYMYITES